MATLTWFGHSAFLLETDGHKILFDPFITGNPLSPITAEQLHPTYILVSHGHGDHLGDTISIAKRTKAIVIGPNELAVYCGMKGCISHPMHIGGSHIFPFGKVKLTIAHHGGGLESGSSFIYLGSPCGFLVFIEGKTFYHAGDTALFLDMKLIGEMNAIDVALLPIGDNYTMGPDDALKAIEFLKPKKVIPMHYNTFEIIKQDVKAFAGKVRGAEVIILEPGKSWKF